MSLGVLSISVRRAFLPWLNTDSVGGLLITLIGNCSTSFEMCIAANSECFQDGTWDERHGYRILARIHFAPNVEDDP
jgi:hypothetical protein